ncbi:hypothetical protein OS190_05155 [Sulfitobacter sp. F26204]|uniref:hypothetical protein n=1 Tax=Sulfitobacter sp. F26204 TaxID=2996014 RepID=UPI00225E3A16|nr:hypothetical protein [Sulfitobacter sp. F26204]MCX7558947.1 hypothetical protein [Sulfitobacter sp. F26204]
MSFAETYGQQVLESRRTRSQRAHLGAKIVSLLLMLLVAVTLRTEPELRSALLEAAMEAAMKATGRDRPPPAASNAAPFAGTMSAGTESGSNISLRDRIKVNRPLSGSTLQGGINQDQVDPQGLAQDLGHRLSTFGANGG